MAEQVQVRTAADLATALSESRRRRGWTQQQLSEHSGVPRTYLARMEAGLSVALLDRTLLVLRRLGAQVVVTLPEPVEQAVPAARPAPETQDAAEAPRSTAR